jgi:hypothetical protein
MSDLHQRIHSLEGEFRFELFPHSLAPLVQVVNPNANFIGPENDLAVALPSSTVIIAQVIQPEGPFAAPRAPQVTEHKAFRGLLGAHRFAIQLGRESLEHRIGNRIILAE